MEILIYVSKITNRLFYIIELILKEELGISFKFTTDKEKYLSHEGPKMHYGKSPLENDNGLFLQSVNLLFERDIADQDVKLCKYNETKAIFPVFNDNSILPFDVLAASFYIITRYEEYLPHVSDQYNRFQPQDSILYKMETFETPIINIWAKELGEIITSKYPDIQLKKKTFKFIPTYDIDAAWAYRNKGLFRTTAAFLRDALVFNTNEIKRRYEVLTKKRIDPFDTFDYQIELQKELKLKPLYFILCGDYNTNDKNISIRNKEFQELYPELLEKAKELSYKLSILWGYRE